MKFGTRQRSRRDGVMQNAALQDDRPMSRLGWFLSVLVVVIPAASVYAWRSGVFASASESAPSSAAHVAVSLPNAPAQR